MSAFQSETSALNDTEPGLPAIDAEQAGQSGMGKPLTPKQRPI